MHNDYRPDPVQTLWQAVFGLDGTNGLRGTQAKHGERLDALEATARDVRLIWTTVRWLALGISTLIGFALSNPIGEAIAKWLKS